jgi:hypothetical protein
MNPIRAENSKITPAQRGCAERSRDDPFETLTLPRKCCLFNLLSLLLTCLSASQGLAQFLFLSGWFQKKEIIQTDCFKRCGYRLSKGELRCGPHSKKNAVLILSTLRTKSGRRLIEQTPKSEQLPRM